MSRVRLTHGALMSIRDLAEALDDFYYDYDYYGYQDDIGTNQKEVIESHMQMLMSGQKESIISWLDDILAEEDDREIIEHAAFLIDQVKAA